MKNKLMDLNNHLFVQIEKLSDDDLSNDQLGMEILRSKAIADIADRIISNAELELKAQVAISEYLIKKPPLMLGIDGYEEEKEG